MALSEQTAGGPSAVGSGRTRRSYQPGIGPYPEAQAVKLVVDELVTLDGAYAAYALDVPYPGSRQRCDWCLGLPQAWDWAIEAKLLRLFRDDGKRDDNALTHILSPYLDHRSALTDCEKLTGSALLGRKAILVIGYEYDGWEMGPAIEAFETLARARVTLGTRHVAQFGDLVHPVHRRGGVLHGKLTPTQDSGGERRRPSSVTNAHDRGVADQVNRAACGSFGPRPAMCRRVPGDRSTSWR